MRGYSFTNFMFSKIQQGIQPYHAALEMAVMYHEDPDSEKSHIFWDWAKNHKTVICLNGGNYASMSDLMDFLYEEENPYPFCPFHEEAAALGAEVLTSIVIVLPERIYEIASLLRGRIVKVDTDPIEELAENLSYVVTVDERARERMTMAEQVKIEEDLRSYNPYTAWEITFINQHLNMCGLA